MSYVHNKQATLVAIPYRKPKRLFLELFQVLGTAGRAAEQSQAPQATAVGGGYRRLLVFSSIRKPKRRSTLVLLLIQSDKQALRVSGSSVGATVHVSIQIGE